MSLAGLYLIENGPAMMFFLFVIGLIASVQVCGASTLVSWLWSGNPRQTALIAQDAMFNGGGIVFTAMTTWLLAANFHWATTYVVVGVIALLISTIASTTDIKEAKDTDAGSGIQTSWNVGILAVGVSVLLFLLGKILSLIHI